MSTLLELTQQGDVGTIRDESKLASVKLMPPQQLYQLWERQHVRKQGDHDARRGAPGERECDHERRLVLVDVDVVQVERHYERHEESGNDTSLWRARGLDRCLIPSANRARKDGSSAKSRALFMAIAA